jgi:mgtE-like transporter
MDKDFREILTSELVSVTGGLVAGILLLCITKQFDLIPGLFILWPGLLDLSGDLSGSVTARLSSALHLGRLDLNKRNEKHILGNLFASLLLAIMMGIILGVIAYTFTLILFHKSVVKLIWLGGVSSFIGSLLVIPVAITLSIMFYVRGNDPNNLTGFMAMLGDTAGAIGLILALVIL